jgi:putative transposase
MERLGHVMPTNIQDQVAGRTRPRKRVAVSRPRPQLPVGAIELWAYDFVCDACANDQ